MCIARFLEFKDLDESNALSITALKVSPELMPAFVDIGNRLVRAANVRIKCQSEKTAERFLSC